MCESLDDEKSKLEDLIYDLSEKINTLSCESSLKDSEKATLQKQIESLSQKNKDLDSKIEEKEKIINENANVKKEISILKEKIREKERNYIKVILLIKLIELFIS